MPIKRNSKEDDANNDTESVASNATLTRASKRSRNSITGRANPTPQQLNTSNDQEDSNDSANVSTANLRAAKRSRSSTATKSQMNSSAELEEVRIRI